MVFRANIVEGNDIHILFKNTYACMPHGVRDTCHYDSTKIISPATISQKLCFFKKSALRFM
jgi:hypothetical protein